MRWQYGSIVDALRGAGDAVSTGPSWATSSRRVRADVQRAIGEFVAGRPVLLADAGAQACAVLPVDALEPGALAALRGLGGAAPRLALSAMRAQALGVVAGGAVRVAFSESVTESALLELAAGANARLQGPVDTERGDRVCDAAIELAKLAHLLPAVVTVARVSDERATGLLRVDASDVLAFRAGIVDSLRLVSSAPVPLRAASDCELMVFRDELGQSWSLIRVGHPDPAAPVPLRLHSACLTGDAFGSLRCDCGDQLQMALAAIERLGGGVLLYLAQEGCGIGLANKMRAYRLQEAGLDTVDANTALGFDADERRYDVAARMLRAAGIARVALLTNNPSKLAAMRASGIDVRERIPLLAPVRGGNRRYLDAKRRRAGHLIGETSTGG